jgi:hypothetical protein
MRRIKNKQVTRREIPEERTNDREIEKVASRGANYEDREKKAANCE